MSSAGSVISHRLKCIQRFSFRLNCVVELVCAALLAAIVLDVWAGVAARYLFSHSLPWTEELARYLMIWMALLAVSCGIVRREHIGLEMLFKKFPLNVQRPLLLTIDCAGILFFSVLLWWGMSMTAGGMKQYANIFSMTMALPFAAVPVSAALAIVQLAATTVIDFYRHHLPASESAGV